MNDQPMISKQASPYCAEIDYWKIVFACLVVMFHFTYIGNPETKDSALFRAGWIAVEFFFLVSGYLLANGVARKAAERKPLVTGALTLWLNKWKRFFPYILSSYFALWVAMGLYANFHTMLTRLPQAFGELSLLFMAGVGKLLLNRPIWYLSSLLICSLICYPFLYRKFNWFTKWLAPVAAVAILVWVSKRENISAPFVWERVAYLGTIRALGCILLGCSLYPAVEWVRQKKLQYAAKWAMLALEMLCFFTVLYIAQAGLAQDWYLEAVALLCIGIMIAFSQQTQLSALLSAKHGKWLGELSLSLFCSHWCIRYILSHFAKNDMAQVSCRRGNAIALLVSLAMALAMMYWVRFLKGVVAKMKLGGNNHSQGESKHAGTGF